MLYSNCHRATARGAPTARMSYVNKTIVGACLVFAFLFLLFPRQALAYTTTTQQRYVPRSADGPTLQVNAGFDTHYRDGNWVPVQVALHNTGPEFNGTVSLSVSNTPSYLAPGSQSTSANYQVPVTLPNGAQKQVIIYAPLYFDVNAVTVKLLDSAGNVVNTQTGTLSPLSTGDILVGILSDQSSGFGPLNAVALPNQSGSLRDVFLNASTMPTAAEVLKNFNLIVLDDFTTGSLSVAQLNALRTWVNQGGALIVIGGPEAHRTLDALPPGLSPVVVNGAVTLPAGTSLLPVGSPGTDAINRVPTLQSAVIASTATIAAQGSRNETVLASGTDATDRVPTPLIVQAHEGQGIVSYLAFDPTLEPIVGWRGATALWKGLLLRSLGEQLFTAPSSSSFGYPTGQTAVANGMSGLLQYLLPNASPSPWLLITLLVGYILILGPARMLIVRHLKQRSWNWRIVLSSIIVFSALSYGLAVQEKGTSIISTSISVVQLGENGSAAHIRTYMGVFAPNQGDFLVHIPGNVLAQPSPDNYYVYKSGPGIITNGSGSSNTTVLSASGGSDVDLQGVDIWTLRAILSEQDQQVHSGLLSHLVLQDGKLVGTVTNSLGYALSDAYVLMPGNVLSLGNLAVGQTKQVSLAVSNTAATSPGLTLADQIAQDQGGGRSYNPGYGPPYYSPSLSSSSSQSLTEQQRHLMILFALEGRGFYNYSCVGVCSQPAPILPIGSGGFPLTGNTVSSGATLTLPGGGPATTAENDPLLVPGASATLIGWAGQPLDATNEVTINNINPTGLHETVVQAPLSVQLSGTLNLPPYFIPGQLIDVQGTGVQSQSDVYTMTTGAITFEYAVPDVTALQLKGLTLTELADVFQNSQGVSNAGVTVPLFLYNWHTGAWDATSFNQNAFTTTNVGTYIGPGGRILLQLKNQDSSRGTFVFSKPLLNLQGVVS